MKSDYKIEPNVAMPKPHNLHRGKYPWREMQIGDSFLVGHQVKGSTIRSGASIAGRKHGREFAVRRTPEGLRCWRIA